MKLITLNLPEPDLLRLDEVVRKKRYPNRSEAIRLAVKDLLEREAYGYGTLYEQYLEKKVQRLSKIMVDWNKRDLDSKEAMWQIWNLFEDENLKLWNKLSNEAT